MFNKSRSLGISIVLSLSWSNAIADTKVPERSPDEVAMVIATLLVSKSVCNVRTVGDDTELAVAVAKLGQDLVDFRSDGRYAPLVKVKMNKSFEFLSAMGKQRGCEAMKSVLRQYIGDILIFH